MDPHNLHEFYDEDSESGTSHEGSPPGVDDEDVVAADGGRAQFEFELLPMVDTDGDAYMAAEEEEEEEVGVGRRADVRSLRRGTLCTDECHLCAPADSQPPMSCAAPLPHAPVWASAPSLLDMPDEILKSIFARLSCKDLCQTRKTCKRAHDAGGTPFVQSRINFSSGWPMPSTQPLYERALASGNFEATMKLGVAFLYGEGVVANVDKAASALSYVEAMSGVTKPFVWLLFRPPWSSEICSKACIFKRLLEMADEDPIDDPLLPTATPRARQLHRARLLYSAGKTMALADPPTLDRARELFSASLALGCGDAAIELGNLDAREGRMCDQRSQLETVAQAGSIDVQLQLALDYIQHRNLTLPDTLITHQRYVQSFVSAGRKGKAFGAKPQKQLDPQGKMRYILMDWLVEVADLKAFSRPCLYMGVDLVDRFLANCEVTRKTLQLVGIACMVVASRFMEEEVITIREAAWLTDNTYVYEQIVKAIGQSLYSAKGDVRTVTQHDYLLVLLRLVKPAPEVEEFVHYISELALINIPSTSYPPAIMASAIFFLTLHTCNFRDCWPHAAQTWTGLSTVDFSDAVMHLHKRLFCGEAVRDHRGVELSAVRDRYARQAEQLNLENLSGQTAPVTEGLKKALNDKIQEERRQRLLQHRSEYDCTPTLDVQPSACFKPLRSITNAGALDHPHEAKRSRRLQPADAGTTGTM